ncbi:MAG: OmpL47-type beta-barrel domain-containing protein [Thermoplasmatota archaeon]
MGQWQDYENPFIVSEIGTHTIKFFSIDSYGNEEEEKTIIFTIKHPCCFEVVIPKGISFGLKAKVKELCNQTHTDVTWNFEISFGKLKAITPLNGTFDIQSGITKTLRSILVIGFGMVHLKLTVDDCKTIDKHVFVTGPFIFAS